MPLPEQPDVTVVVATRNRAQRLALLLESLRRQTLPHERFEVVVVDDNSSDRTPDVLREAATRGDLRLRVQRRERNEGLSVARNQGWRAGSGAVVAFTDDDCEAAPGWLEAGLAACARSPSALVQGRTDPHPRELDRLGPFARTIRVHELGPWYQTCNVFYPRSLLERLGGFDEDGFRAMGGSDTDLAWRALEAGARAEFAPEAQVHHAVLPVGPAGRLRVAARWSDTVQIFRRHPELRRSQMTHRVFWKGSHYLLVRALLAWPLPRRWWLVRRWLAYPYVLHLFRRCRAERASPLVVPYYLVHDLVELYAMARGSVRHRTLVL